MPSILPDQGQVPRIACSWCPSAPGMPAGAGVARCVISRFSLGSGTILATTRETGSVWLMAHLRPASPEIALLVTGMQAAAVCAQELVLVPRRGLSWPKLLFWCREA